MFRVLGSVDALNDQMNLGLTWHDVAHMNECHPLVKGYYLKSRSEEVRLISCIPSPIRSWDDYLVVSGEWHDGLYCPIMAGTPGGVL